MSTPEAALYVYVIAYAYALFVGLFVGPVTDLMYDLTGVERSNKFKWQPPILGIVERTPFPIFANSLAWRLHRSVA